jgi:thioredoxin:protein disulfide reductase
MKRLLTTLLLVFPFKVFAVLGGNDFLPPDEAFKLHVERQGDATVIAKFQSAPHHYLYHDRISFELRDASGPLGLEARLPKGELKSDPTLGDTEIYHRPFVAVVEARADTRRLPGADLLVSYQGCSEEGLCYPPIVKTFKWSDLKLADAHPGQASASLIRDANAGTLSSESASSSQVTSASVEGSETDQIAGLFRGGSVFTVVAAFFVAGLLLAFTPCVFPMIPILSGIIVGQGEDLRKSRAFALSLAYVLGMAITYSAAGVAAGLSGKLLSAALQNAWVLGSFAVVFVVLSLSMFGVFELQLPSAMQSKFNEASGKIRGGSVAGVFGMGALSAVIVGPCVAPPLAGALLYIGQTHNVVLGGAALFAMALGIGVPLLLVGTSAGALLPRAGGWMNAVKKVFGVLLLGVAIWLVSPVLPVTLIMLLVGALLVVCAIFLSAIDPLPSGTGPMLRFGKGMGVLALIAGTSLVVGALSGGRDITQPLGGLRMANAASPGTTLRFTRVATVAEVESYLRQFAGKPVVLDFYADWCVSCKEMEHNTFTDQRVQAKLKNALLLQADVTANKVEHAKLLRRFGLFGPPGIVFFDHKGSEMKTAQVVGYQPPEKFLASLGRVPGLN